METMITLVPIGIVRNERRTIEDDNWNSVISTVELDESFGEEAFAHIEDFSHIEIIYWFHLVDPQRIVTGARHPRDNEAWPQVGIFAQRGKNRPNRLGSTIARILNHEGRRLTIKGLDAIDGTPVLDIKPIMQEFLPREGITQPEWVAELMNNYWQHGNRPADAGS